MGIPSLRWQGRITLPSASVRRIPKTSVADVADAKQNARELVPPRSSHHRRFRLTFYGILKKDRMACGLLWIRFRIPKIWEPFFVWQASLESAELC